MILYEGTFVLFNTEGTFEGTLRYLVMSFESGRIVTQLK
jgi:hypothetical protein